MKSLLGRCGAIPFLSILVFLAFLTPAHGASCVVFTDGTFDPAEWVQTNVMAGNGGVIAMTQSSGNGNTVPFEHVITDVRSGSSDSPAQDWGFLLKTNALYNPQSQGGMASLDYAEDAIFLSGIGGFGSEGQGTGPALLQNGHLYVPFDGLATGLGSAWHALSLSNLKQTDFVLVTGNGPLPSQFLDATQHPDFSPSGSTIEFGFYRANTSIGDAYSVEAGIDNWTIAINASPSLSLQHSSGLTTLSWSSIVAGATYDLVRGDLPTLHSSGGDFAAALDAINPSTDVCMADDTAALSMQDSATDPGVGGGWFYLVRCDTSTYDSGAPSQMGSRDAEIAAAVGACP